VVPGQRYDTIGVGYATYRQPDPRIGAQIWAAIGDAERIVNVGAGTGSYEDPTRTMVAVEPSEVMMHQRGPHAAPVVRASAEHLPFPDHSFDVALALMTIHHWQDVRAGLAELRRVAPRQVVFTFDPQQHDALWLFHEYVTAAIDLDITSAPLDLVVDALRVERVEVVRTPADCTDGFGSAYWRRPEMYLDPAARANISVLARLPEDQVAPGLARLRQDLDSGAWHKAHAALLAQDSIDAGLRLVIAG
jgi:SAM-dependent methyltransferase